MKVLITGSREASQGMLDYVGRVVKRCKDVGNTIIVGDAEGVDTEVVKQCEFYWVPCTVYAANSKLRMHTYEGQSWFYIVTHGGYLARDRVMVELADTVIACWNGRSYGTKYTYDYAMNIGKSCWMWREK